MTKQEMIAKLEALTVGSKIEKDGKVYTVRAITQDTKSALRRTDIGLLEDGKPETYQKEGKYLAAGKILTFSNIQVLTWYAQNTYMNWKAL